MFFTACDGVLKDHAFSEISGVARGPEGEGKRFVCISMRMMQAFW